MNYRTIAVHINESGHTAERVRHAVALARRCDAHLIGVAAVGLSDALMMAGVGASAATVQPYRDMLEREAEAALGRFERAAEAAGLRSFQPRRLEQEAGVALCLQARYSDLLVIGQDDPEESICGQRAGLQPYVVLHAGRPVLTLPHAGSVERIGRRVVIAWDGGLQAARAVAGALPLLRRAEMVQAIAFERGAGAGSDVLPDTELAGYLARHGIGCEIAPALWPRDRHRQRAAVACGRCRCRPAGNGRLRPFALPRDPARRRHPHGAGIDDGAGPDGALNTQSASDRRTAWTRLQRLLQRAR